MNDSHESSRSFFENSCEELDFLCAEARDTPGCLGARLTGAGFGGAILALVPAPQAGEFSQRLAARVGQVLGRPPQILVTAAEG